MRLWPGYDPLETPSCWDEATGEGQSFEVPSKEGMAGDGEGKKEMGDGKEVMGGLWEEGKGKKSDTRRGRH